MSSLEFVPVQGSAFEQIVDRANWCESRPSDPSFASRLRVAEGLGWLVAVSETGDPTDIIGFSVESVSVPGDLLPPKDIKDVQQRLGTANVGWFNTDMTAKGLGSTMANTPQGLQPHSMDVEIAVRSIPFASEDMYQRAERDTILSRKMRLFRHGALLAVSTALDKASASVAGTDRAMQYMERRYGDARLVEMPAPPIWQEQQQAAGIVPAVAPRILLVRGGQLAASNRMSRVGTYPIVER